MSARQALRRRLLEERARFMNSGEAGAAEAALADHLAGVLAELSPECLGVYWPHRSEFNAARPWQGGSGEAALPLALPFARREPREMHYRRWDGAPPVQVDGCGIPAVEGALVVPDVVLAPCVGYTDEGLRLGYGGGYFDRFLAAYPHVTAIGVAWTMSRVDAAELPAEPHDRPLMLVVTERGVVG